MSAENERIKLTATFYNNLAVGAAVTGLVVPYLSIYPKFFHAETWAPESGFSNVVSLETALGMGVALAVCLFCRSRANTWIRTLED
jgi:hypothetical protein